MYAKFLLNICRKILKLHVESQSNSTASIEQQNIQEFTLTYHYTLQNTQAPSNFLCFIFEICDTKPMLNIDNCSTVFKTAK